MSNECNIFPKVKYIFMVKKGMAEKAFIKNIQLGNTNKIKKQIEKGTVKRIR